MLNLLQQPIETAALESFASCLREALTARRELEQYRQRDQSRLRALESRAGELLQTLERVAASDERLQVLLVDAGLVAPAVTV